MLRTVYQLGKVYYANFEQVYFAELKLRKMLLLLSYVT